MKLKLWQKCLLILYVIAPLSAGWEVQRGSYERDYCYLYQDYREMDYQKRYDEGFKVGYNAGKEASVHEARAASFKVLIELIDRSGLAPEERNMRVKQAKMEFYNNTI